MVFVTDKNYIIPNLQGYSQTDPIRSQGTVIFKPGLGDATVYAHELGHMLGLEHNFVKDFKDLTSINDDLNNLTRNKSVADKKQEIEEDIAFKENYINDDIKKVEELKVKDKLSEKEKKELQGLQENIDETEKSIQKLRNRSQKIDVQTTVANLKVAEGKTKNYMDYISNRIYFAKYQAEIVKKEVVDFYQK